MQYSREVFRGELVCFPQEALLGSVLECLNRVSTLSPILISTTTQWWHREGKVEVAQAVGVAAEEEELHEFPVNLPLTT
jgi:hypothetical protein